MVVDGKATFLGDFLLPFFNFGVVELFHPAALQAHQMIVMLALVEFEHGLVAVEVVTHEQAGLFELSQYPVNRGQANVLTLVLKQLVDFLGCHVPFVALLEQVENLQSRQCGLETDVLQVAGLAHSELRIMLRTVMIALLQQMSGVGHVNALRLIPLVLSMAACTSVNVPLSPHRIDVQQGNAMDRESVDKLKTGMTRSQVRFLLGTPLLVDPFHTNRWDYVYHYRTSGKLTEKKRLTLVFEGDVLARIEGEGFSPASSPAMLKPSEQTAVASAKPPVVPESFPLAAPAPPVGPGEPGADKTTIAATPAPSPDKVSLPSSQADRRLDETSIVPPLRQPETQLAEAKGKPTLVTDRPPESVLLQKEANVEAVKPDVMPAFTDAAQPAQSPEERVVAATNDWAQAWRARDEDAYIAAYASSFRPQGGLSRAEWEKRRRLLLGLSRNIDLKLDSVSTEIQGDNKALVTFNQFYTSDTYQDAVIKQLRLILVDDRWLIEEEKVLGPLKIRK